MLPAAWLSMEKLGAMIIDGIVGRGDWLGKPANFKGQNSSAVTDVGPTLNVTLTVHNFIQDGGQYRPSVCLGRRLRGNYRNFGRR